MKGGKLSTVPDSCLRKTIVNFTKRLCWAAQRGKEECFQIPLRSASAREKKTWKKAVWITRDIFHGKEEDITTMLLTRPKSGTGYVYLRNSI